jgi:hypothetical protein
VELAPELVVCLRRTAIEGPSLILIGQAETGAESMGGAEDDGVGGTLIAKVVDLSRNMYFTKRTTDRASVTIWSPERLKAFHSRYSWRGTLTISSLGAAASRESSSPVVWGARPKERPVIPERNQPWRWTKVSPRAMIILTLWTTGLGFFCASSSCMSLASSSSCHVVLFGSQGDTSMTRDREAGKKVMNTTKLAMMDMAPNQQTISNL